jgi:hypothetical protein
MQKATGKELASNINRATTQVVKFLISPVSFKVSMLAPSMYQLETYRSPRQTDTLLSYMAVAGLEDATTLATTLLTKQVPFAVNAVGHRQYQFEVSADLSNLLAPSKFDCMSLEELCSWYEEVVGYDPLEDEPSTQLENLRSNCKELALIHACEGVDSEAYHLIEGDRLGAVDGGN